MKKQSFSHWALTGLFASVATIAFISFTGGSARGEGWICPQDDDTKMTGRGIDVSEERACTEARREGNTKCQNAAGGKDCCAFGDCVKSCVPLESHGICYASLDAFPYVYEIVIDGGDGGSEDGGGSGSGN